jgi:LacI family transcriptional regulator
MDAMQKRSSTIQDVARRAGVGVGTVSRVLNDHPNVTQATREQVLRVIADLGYRPKSAAVTLRTRQTREIGLITDEIATTPFAFDLIRGAQDEAWAHQSILVLINTSGNLDLLNAALDQMYDRQVRGVLYAAMFHQPVNLPERFRELPAVLVDCYSEDRSLPSVVPNEIQGGQDAVATLLQHGHRRIGFINYTTDQPAVVGRLEGYRRALAAAGVAYDPTLVRQADIAPDAVYRTTIQLMQQPDRPTALFCFNDRTAMWAYDALRDLALRVPEEVAVIGFDNQELLAANLRPPLTTMQLPHYEMGRWAVHHLIAGNPQPSPTAPQVQLDCPLVWRASV